MVCDLGWRCVFVRSYSRQRLGFGNELLMGVQDKWLQAVDGNLAIRLLPSLDGRLGQGASSKDNTPGRRCSAWGPGKSIGRPSSERAGRIIINLVARGDPLKGLERRGRRLPHAACQRSPNIRGPDGARLGKREKRQGV